MAEPTIAQVFGTGATRLASGATAPSAGLFIPDSALQAAGLTNPSTATAEGSLTAIVKNAKSYLTEDNFESNIDQSLTVTDGFGSLVFRGDNQQRFVVDQLNINLAKADTSTGIDPNNY